MASETAALIRAENRRAGRRIAVLDDDPTGSQTVHDVQLVTSLAAGEIAAALHEPGSTCFILTNSRSLDTEAATTLAREAGELLFELPGEEVTIVSRSDSTLRGHIIAEVGALDDARRRRLGAGFDGVLFVPAYFEAGRRTVDDIHSARVDGKWVPVGETEFARDATFGYAESDLRDHIAARSGGRITRDEVESIGLPEIRAGRAARVSERLDALHDAAFIVVNALDYEDLEQVVLGLGAAERAGKRFLCRTGPSFARALTGLDAKPPLSADDVWRGGRPRGQGLVVVGSHTELTTRQLARARAAHPLRVVELDVARVLDDASRADHIAAVARQASHALADGDVVISSSRSQVVHARDRAPLAIARSVSDALSQTVARVRTCEPGWVIAKGGITSHDIAAHGLGVERAEVVGQLFDGLVTVIRPIVAAPEAVGIPYVIFAGNVGDDDALAYAIDVMKATADD